MICIECNKDLEECECPDLKDRFQKILNSGFIYVGGEYQLRIQENIRRQEQRRQAECKK